MLTSSCWKTLMDVLSSINMSILKSCCYYTSKYFSIKRLQDICQHLSWRAEFYHSRKQEPKTCFIKGSLYFCLMFFFPSWTVYKWQFSPWSLLRCSSHKTFKDGQKCSFLFALEMNYIVWKQKFRNESEAWKQVITIRNWYSSLMFMGLFSICAITPSPARPACMVWREGRAAICLNLQQHGKINSRATEVNFT